MTEREPPTNVHAFFQYARDREAIRIAKESGQPKPWTNDPIFQDFRFCNVFREDDKVTRFFRENIRKKYDSSPALILATVAFRWFNRIETGRALFLMDDLEYKMTPFDMLVAGVPEWRAAAASSIRNVCGEGPYVTGAYMIRTPTGMDKLQGSLQNIYNFYSETHSVHGQPYNWRTMGELLIDLKELNAPMSLEVVWEWMRQYPLMGDFIAYEAVTDLSQSDLLSLADRDVWANPGPGAARGMGWVHSGDKDQFRPTHKDVLNKLMCELLQYARRPEYWPQDWQRWDMRTVEHTLCEFDKYMRVLSGQGRPRQRFQGT